MKNPPALILASTSPRRAELLREINLAFTVASAKVEEVHGDHLTPRELCQLNALRKARAVALEHPDRIVLAADTLVCLGTRLFGKPANLDQAAATLSELQGQAHEVITGVCLTGRPPGEFLVFTESTTVWFHPLTTAQIAEYLQRINPLDKAGAYAIQEHGHFIVRAICGSFSNVVGLPTERVVVELDRYLGP